jgi:hypothetical protein
MESYPGSSLGGDDARQEAVMSRCSKRYQILSLGEDDALAAFNLAG